MYSQTENKIKLLNYIIVSLLFYPVIPNAHGGRTDINVIEGGKDKRSSLDSI